MLCLLFLWFRSLNKRLPTPQQRFESTQQKGTIATLTRQPGADRSLKELLPELIQDSTVLADRHELDFLWVVQIWQHVQNMRGRAGLQ